MNIFTHNLFVPLSTGIPQSLTASLSSSSQCVSISSSVATYSVVITSLSAYAGLAFNSMATTYATSAIQAATIQGCSLRIAKAYNNTSFALIKPDRSVTLFTFLSASTAQTPISASLDYTTPELRRLAVLGYV